MLLGLPDDSPASLAAAVRSNPGLRWVQGTAAGTGEQVKAVRPSPEELERVMITSASGVHVSPLAEFCLLGLLHFTKGVPRLWADQRGIIGITTRWQSCAAALCSCSGWARSGPRSPA